MLSSGKPSMFTKSTDAVLIPYRECLKDLPDTVIFHLKRFEFSLRTLQRSKINDYFAFPASIDLKPYTVDHLNDPTLEGEDVFELVGILVHTGTAESGHYYSFIRERPCKSDPPSWVEFNDDHVAPWDPALMEGSTFGGPDFDANGNFYEKAYSAYMLFYQRKSYLSSQQDEIAIKETPVPVRFDIDEELKEHIMVENTNLLRRHCLFDPGYALWVKSLFDNACQLEATANTPSQDSMMDEDETDNGSASAENLRDLAMEVLLSHLDQIVSRTRDLPDFTVYMDTLEEAIRNSAENAYSFYKYFFLRPDALRALIQRNSEPLVRQRMSLQFIRALQKLSSDMPQLYSRAPVDDDLDLDAFDTDSNALVGGRLGVPVVEGVMNIFRYLWKYFHIHIRAWDEYFGTLLGFAQMGKQETACLLGDDYLLKLCRIIAADRMMDLPANYSHMLQSILRRFNTRTTSYLEVISVIDHLLKKLAPTLGPDTIVESPQERLYLQQEPFDWTSMEASFIHDHPRNRNHSFFLEKLLGLDQNPVATDDIVVRLSQLSEQMDASVAQTLRVNIRLDGPSQPVQPFLRAALPYLGSATNASRAERLVAHIAHHAKLMHPVHIPLFLSFFRGALNLDPRTNQLAVRVHDHCLDLVPDWAPCMLAHPVDDVRDVVTQLLHRELFPFGPYHDFGGDEEAYEKHLRRARVIQRLAIQCLLYLQEAYVKRGVAISREQAQRVLETATRCRDYFVLDPDTAQALTDTFAALHQS
jgi:ubiquitin carboxyl-terminal hydrolase 34